MAMKSKTKYLIPIILALLFLSSVGTGFAQGQEVISAEVDRTTLSTDEVLTLTVRLNDSAMSVPRPTLPSLQGFNVLGSSTSSQISVINGSMSSQVIYAYRLQPYAKGDLVIEPISVTLDGRTYSTDPIAVHVTQGTGTPGTGAPAPASSNRQQAITSAELTGQDLFIEAEVDNPTPYVGQQVVYTFRFYRAVNLWDQPHYEAPSFQGFWNEHQMDEQEYQAQAAGRMYRVTEIRSILFPSVLGPVTIEPARLTIPGGFFSSGKTLQTRPVELSVQPLPPNAPEGFNGAVGQFTLTGTLEPTQGKVNEPLTWQVTLNGQGNINAAPDPVWPEVSGWRDFETQATVQTDVQGGLLAGSRLYERLLVPGAEGEFAIPPLEYVFFDPIAGGYQTISTEPIPVSIALGSAEAPAPLPVTGKKETVEQIATDIRHLKPVPSRISLDGQPVTGSALYWAAWVFPVFGAVGFFAWQRRQRYWDNNLGRARSSQARRKARKALAQARRQKQEAYDAAGQILTAYLADKLDRPVAGLTHQALADLLSSQGVSADLIERIEVLLVSSELGRFMPGADNADHARSLLKEVDILIDALERVL
jgi:hypothetical protein